MSCNIKNWYRHFFFRFSVSPKIFSFFVGIIPFVINKFYCIVFIFDFYNMIFAVIYNIAQCVVVTGNNIFICANLVILHLFTITCYKLTLFYSVKAVYNGSIVISVLNADKESLFVKPVYSIFVFAS